MNYRQRLSLWRLAPSARCRPKAIQTVWNSPQPPDLVVFEEFCARRRTRIESTSGKAECVYHLELPNGRQVLLRDRIKAGPASPGLLAFGAALGETLGERPPATPSSVAAVPVGGTFWIVAEVPADASRAVSLGEADVAGELRRIAARPPREPALLTFLEES